MHQNYDESTFHNDIALIKLHSPIKLDYKEFKIIPVCIPNKSSQFQNNYAYATGWGIMNKKLIILN